MKRSIATRTSLACASVIAAIGLAALPVSALATTGATTSATASSAAQTQTSATDQRRLSNIKQRGDAEITRRLTTLNKLSNKISTTTKLSAADKASLANQVTSEISGLQALKTKLDADTDVATARSDAQGIITGYRVYALIVPKIYLVSAADGQQTTEADLSTMSTALQSRITTAQQAGKNVANLQTQLNDLNAKVAAATPISSSIENALVNLQPSDYNADHSILSGDHDKLKTAATDITAALKDARSITDALANL